MRESIWEQFVKKKERWIGGKMQDFEYGVIDTEITDMTLKPSGQDSMFFSVEGKDFSCGFNVRYGGISGKQDENSDSITFNRMYLGAFRIHVKE
jgi:hypothetical protein